MRYFLIILISAALSVNLSAGNVLSGDTLLPSEHKFKSNEVYVPKAFDPAVLIKQYMEHLKDGKRCMGFLHSDEVAMIEEKDLTEKRLFFDSYKVVSIGKRSAMVKVYTARGTSISCKMLMLRYYQNMHGHYLLVPGKVSTFQKKMGDITLKKVYLDTWTQEMRCQ